MSHIFISYSRQDLEFAQHLVNDLSAAGLNIWFDQISIQPGENWDIAVENGLRQALAVLVVISPDSMASRNVRNEVNFALNFDQALLPVLYRPAQVFLNLQSIQWLDLSSENLYKNNLTMLVQRLRQEQARLALRPLSDTDITLTDQSRPLSVTQFPRYFSIMGLIAAPFADSSGENPPAESIAGDLEWQNLYRSLVNAYRSQDTSLPFHLRRILPPTPAALRDALLAAQNAPNLIVHLVAHGDHNAIYFESDKGHEAPVSHEELLAIFRDSRTMLVLLNGCLSRALATDLTTQTGVQAVIGTDRHVPDDATRLFITYFYGHLLNGATVRTAFQETITHLAETHPEEKQHYHLVLKAGLDDIQLPTPSAIERAHQPLVDTGSPRILNAPTNIGFTGQRQTLNALREALETPDTRVLALYGIAGIGKSWTLCEYIQRFGWRYPDGILWMRVSEQTKSEDIIGQLLSLLELSATTLQSELREELSKRRVLLVLDQADEWRDPLEVGELTDFITRLNTLGGTRVVLTSRRPVEPLTHGSGVRDLTHPPLLNEDAQALLQHLIDQNELATAFPDENTRTTFLEKTFHLPFLIVAGIKMTQRHGLEAALQSFAYPDSELDAFEDFIDSQINSLPDGERGSARVFLCRLQLYPDGLEYHFAEAFGGVDTQAHLRRLVNSWLVRREGGLYSLPETVRTYLRRYLPLTDEEQDRLDETVIRYLLSD